MRTAARQRSLQLFEHSGAFVFLGLGFAISLLVFLFEKFMSLFVGERRRETSVNDAFWNGPFLAFTISTKILFASDGQLSQNKTRHHAKVVVDT